MKLGLTQRACRLAWNTEDLEQVLKFARSYKGTMPPAIGAKNVGRAAAEGPKGEEPPKRMNRMKGHESQEKVLPKNQPEKTADIRRRIHPKRFYAECFTVRTYGTYAAECAKEHPGDSAPSLHCQKIWCAAESAKHTLPGRFYAKLIAVGKYGALKNPPKNTRTLVRVFFGGIFNAPFFLSDKLGVEPSGKCSSAESAIHHFCL